MKRVLLVYPEIPATYWSFKYVLPFVGKSAAYPPLGLLTVASLLPDDYDVKLVDMNISKLNEKDILNSDLVFTSSMIVQKESLEKVINICNKLGKPVVAGGPYPTSSYRNIKGVQHFLLNEAETTIPEFLIDYKKGKAKKVYTSNEKPDITKTPIPRFDLLDVNKYSSMALQFSRGCPFNCEFCDIIEMFGQKSRTKTSGQFLNELERIYNTGYRGSIFIVDDNFIGNKRNVKNLLAELSSWQKERHYPFIFFTEASINLSQDEELMDLMALAGFNMVFIGIETPVRDSLIKANKKQNLQGEILESVEKIQKKGMEVSAGFIIGFDSDPENIFDLQIEFIHKSGIPMAMVGLLLALPNTRLYRRLLSEKRIIDDSSGNNTHDLHMNFTPVMDQNTIIDGYKKVISDIYNPANYFNRCILLLKNLPHKPNSAGEVSFLRFKMGFRAFMLSLIRQSFSSYGHRYIQYLIKTLFLRPALFPKAVRMAIIGQHFFRITNGIISADNFKDYLCRVGRYIQNKTDKITTNNLEDAFRDFVLLNKNVISKIRNGYHKQNKDFQNYVELSMKELSENIMGYLDKLISSISMKFEKISISNIEELIKELKICRMQMRSGLIKKYLKKQDYLKRYLDDLFYKFEKTFYKIIWEYKNL